MRSSEAKRQAGRCCSISEMRPIFTQDYTRQAPSGLDPALSTQKALWWSDGLRHLVGETCSSYIEDTPVTIVPRDSDPRSKSIYSSLQGLNNHKGDTELSMSFLLPLSQHTPTVLLLYIKEMQRCNVSIIITVTNSSSSCCLCLL